MPVQLLPYTPVYCLVGIYRLFTDPLLWRPIWLDSEKAVKKAAALSAVWAPVAYPFTKFFVKHFVKRVAIQKWKEESQYLGLSMLTLATLGMLLGQVSAIFEYFLSKQLAKARKNAYDRTVISRGKDHTFWGPYQEEWKEPPLERAQRSIERRTFYERLNSSIVRMVVLRFLLFPLAFIPFLPTIIMAGIRSLTLAEHLQEPFFKSKHMNELQQATFVVERQMEFRVFGFVAALLERLPLVGLVFSISNRIGAAMWAHDLEKQQHLYASGELQPEKVYVSKTARIPQPDAPGLIGGFPGKAPPPPPPAEPQLSGTTQFKQRRVPPKPDL